MTQQLYARFYELDDGTKCYELLSHHLALTSFVMLKLCLASPWCRRDGNNIKIAVLAGLLHDIGKALSIYQKDGATRLSFGNPPHEEVSAYIASPILSILSQVQQVNPQVQSTVVRAIEMHHQGLRLLTLWGSRKVLNLVRNIKKEDLNNICMCIKESVDLLKKMLSYLGGLDCHRDLAEFLDKLNFVAELNLELHAQPQSSKDIDIVIAKLFTGMLIAADYFATRLNLLRVSSKCVEETLVANEIYNYMVSLNLSDIQNTVCSVLGGCIANSNPGTRT